MENRKMRLPDNFEQYEEVMSNCDHSVDYIVAEFIKGKPLWSQYSGWNFVGYVWYQDNKWCCEVWVYGRYQTTVIANSLEEIMIEVCAIYGND